MTVFRLSNTSKQRLAGVHPELIAVVNAAIRASDIDFAVLEGVRTPERQAALYAAGASKTLNSRHLTGHAVDLGAFVAGEIRWDWPLYTRIAEAMKSAALRLEVPIVWGGDWKKFRDGPHFELDRRAYPAENGD